MFSNPFTVGRPVREDVLFVGRLNIKQTVLGALGNLGSVCIVGERRTGKTSLLFDIHGRIRTMGKSQPIICVYMDCSDISTIADFWKEFIAQLKLEASGQLVSQIDAIYSSDRPDIEATADRVLKTITITHSVVMLLDEFDYILEKDAFAGNFLLRLRKYGSLHNVAYVTASRQRLEAHYSSPTPSPFFNIFLVTILGLFPEHEARELLNKTLQDGNPVFNEDEIVHLLQVSGCYPYFLQLAASILYTMKYGNAETYSNWREIHLTRFYAASRQHFDYYWEKSSDEEKELLWKLSTGKENMVMREETVKMLIERSLVTTSRNRLLPFSPVWATWIVNRVESKEEQGKTGSHDASADHLSTTMQHANENRPGEPAGSISVSKEGAKKVIKILFLAANPVGTERLRLDKEVNAIDNALRLAEFRMFDIKQHWAVSISELQGYLLRHQPNIVHFSGHGTAQSEIILEDSHGQSKPVPTKALSKLFSILKDDIQCVVLNACYTEPQAKAIAEHIDCVIGMSKAIGDTAAISFAASFYQALGFGRDMQTAFDLGCLQIDMESLGDEDVPTLLATKGNPKNITLVS